MSWGDIKILHAIFQLTSLAILEGKIVTAIEISKPCWSTLVHLIHQASEDQERRKKVWELFGILSIENVIFESDGGKKCNFFLS